MNVKPSKIVAGIEAEKTNDLLQALALMLENKHNSNTQQKNNTSSAKPEKKGILLFSYIDEDVYICYFHIHSCKEKYSIWHYLEGKQCIKIYSQIRCHKQTSTQHQ